MMSLLVLAMKREMERIKGNLASKPRLYVGKLHSTQKEITMIWEIQKWNPVFIFNKYQLLWLLNMLDKTQIKLNGQLFFKIRLVFCIYRYVLKKDNPFVYYCMWNTLANFEILQTCIKMWLSSWTHTYLCRHFVLLLMPNLFICPRTTQKIKIMAYVQNI